eukprot:507686_1
MTNISYNWKSLFKTKVGPWSYNGGNQWSVAVDAKNMISIATITGGRLDADQKYRTILGDGTECCDRTGSIHGINLTSGDTIWQIVNPWGTINDCNDTKYDEYVDDAVWMTCHIGPNGDPIKDPSETVMNVVIPPINEDERDQIPSSALGAFIGPLTIAGDLVFIPSYSGDVFIHNLFNGEYIHTLQCPNRQVIKGGITVVDDRVLFICGSNTVVSMK